MSGASPARAQVNSIPAQASAPLEAPLDKPGTRANRWVETWHKERQARLASADDNYAHWTKHLRSVLGSKHPRNWQRDDLRRLHTELKGKVQAEKLSPKTARNCWSTVTTMLDSAVNSDDDRIQCREDNPALGLKGPKRCTKTALQYLFPTEVLQVRQL